MSDESAHNRPTVPLAASLALFTENLIARRGVEQANILFGGQIDPAIQALRVRTKAVGVGDKAPDFSMPMAEGGTWSLAEHLAQNKYSSLVMVFYRGTWCGYCNVYLRGLLGVQSLLSEANAALIAVSPEAVPVFSDNTTSAGSIFPVPIDQGGKIAEQFGLTFEMDDAAKNILKDSNIDLENEMPTAGGYFPYLVHS